MTLSAYKGYEHLRVSSPGPFVAHVELAREQKLNAFHEPMWLEFGRIFRQLSSDPDVRSVVLSGAGDRAFTAGLDVHAASQGTLAGGGPDIDGARRATLLRRHIQEFQDSISAMEQCEKRRLSPFRLFGMLEQFGVLTRVAAVVCVLHGVCLGLAIDISCCADVRLAAADARLAVKEVDIGLAADIGTLSRLPRAVGSGSWVKEVCLTGRVFGAAEAQAVGFVSAVHPGKAAALAAALEVASVMASKSPVAVQGTKELLNHARDSTVAESECAVF
jgi:Delta3,5-Delta2,4-dienoyl-CoA isomerase